MIKLQNIRHSYNNDNFIIKNFSLNIGKSESIGLTGPSGCGKSTLAHIISGYITPSSGKVLIKGMDFTGQPSRNIFLISQESDLFPWQKVKKQIEFALKEKSARRIDEILALVKLEKYKNYYPAQLSGGMKKRLSLARALAVNPKLLILDEAFVSLDSELKNNLYCELREIWQTTKTAILVITHDIIDLENLVEKRLTYEQQAKKFNNDFY
ncbi:MAG: ABC transporter ATP-binding protein [Patescibacteria group bacterium]|nr:ABC transporter ATP-binding protein [Patescibacteria group bacterium]